MRWQRGERSTVEEVDGQTVNRGGKGESERERERQTETETERERVIER